MKKFFALFVILLVGQVSFAQSAEPKPVLIDEFGRFCGEDGKSRLDNLAIHLQDSPSSKAYIVFHGGIYEGRNLDSLEFFRLYLTRTKGLDADRFTVFRGKNLKEIRVQLWVVPIGANPPTVNDKFIEQKVTSPTKFDKAWADVWELNTPAVEREYWDFLGNSLLQDACESINLTGFANQLEYDSKFRGYVVIYTAFGKGNKRANRVATLVMRDLRKWKAPLNRVQTIYGGSRKEPEAELWLVPEGQTLPLIKTKK